MPTVVSPRELARLLGDVLETLVSSLAKDRLDVKAERIEDLGMSPDSHDRRVAVILRIWPRP